jgi:3'(2'), 5'-bisphosphate nucleotidase
LDLLLEQVIQITRHAGAAIMEVYDSNEHEVEFKDDDSPLTRADKAANDLIIKELEKISDYPIISEENETRTVNSTKYWLVDPLDGTKEFINKNGEFTVNIALIEYGEPVLGAVYAPAIDELYAGLKNKGAIKQTVKGTQTLQSEFKDEVPVIVVSRSHKDERVTKLLEKIGEHREINMGSSLKLCLVAEGKAMFYPRLAPTYLWDTAAADAIVRAAGGTVKNLEDEPLKYDPNHELKNPFFIASTKNSLLVKL